MQIRVLGSAAGGGFPQWNCACLNCQGVRSGTIRAQARTQESVAVGNDLGDWFVLNASPEIRHHIESFDCLHPQSARGTPIQGILLTNGDLDHCLGLLSLRESEPIRVYATGSVWRGFTGDNVLFRTLDRFAGQVSYVPLELDRQRPLIGRDGRDSGLVVQAIAVPGKLPIHLAGHHPSPEDNVALRVTEASSGKCLAYIPAAANLDRDVERAVERADTVFFDGTFWSSDELIQQGLGDKRAEDMAHWPVGGSHGSLRWLGGLSSVQRVFIHINNTNPMLREDSPEHRAVVDAGVSIAHDGMQLCL